MLIMTGVKNTTPYVSHSLHTWNPAYIVQTYKKPFQYMFFSKYFFFTKLDLIINLLIIYYIYRLDVMPLLTLIII